MSPVRRTLTTAAIATAALSIGATGAEAAVPCFKTYSNVGSGWKVGNDGSLTGSLSNTGSAGDAGHGRLTVGGAAYPELAGNQCVQSDSAMSFPTRNLGGFSVARSVTVTGGKLRWLDTITNPGGGKNLAVDFALEVLPSQLIKATESGNDTADEDDHWTAHQSQTLFSTHQWGQDGAIAQPDVVPEDGGPRWEDDFGDMDDDATLRYSFFIGAGQTVRLLHGTGTATTLKDATDSAKNAASLFTGYTRAVADDIVNFSDDPDADGVTKFNDDCPSVKGDNNKGCTAILLPADPADPVDPDAPAPAPPAQDPAPAPAPQNGGGTPAAPTAPAGGTVATPDTAGPVVTVGRIAPKVRRSKLTGRSGTPASITCSEDCRFTAKLVVKRKGSKKLVTVQRFADQGFSTKARDLRLKVKSSKLRRLSSPRVTLVIEATDRAGNRTSVSHRIGLR